MANSGRTTNDGWRGAMLYSEPGEAMNTDDKNLETLGQAEEAMAREEIVEKLQPQREKLREVKTKLEEVKELKGKVTGNSA